MLLVGGSRRSTLVFPLHLRHVHYVIQNLLVRAVLGGPHLAVIHGIFRGLDGKHGASCGILGRLWHQGRSILLLQYHDSLVETHI